MYPNYLIHFNRVHDPKTGRFSWGDGDGDGIRNDHGNQSSKLGSRSSPRKITQRYWRQGNKTS